MWPILKEKDGQWCQLWDNPEGGIIRHKHATMVNDMKENTLAMNEKGGNLSSPRLQPPSFPFPSLPAAF